MEVLHEEEAADALLEPWLLSVDGGREGWLFRELQNLFCLAQLLHQGKHSTEPRHISDRLPVCELPDLLRAIGFYPSQFDVSERVPSAEVQWKAITPRGDHLN